MSIFHRFFGRSDAARQNETADARLDERSEHDDAGETRTGASTQAVPEVTYPSVPEGEPAGSSGGGDSSGGRPTGTSPYTDEWSTAGGPEGDALASVPHATDVGGDPDRPIIAGRAYNTPYAESHEIEMDVHVGKAPPLDSLFDGSNDAGRSAGNDAAMEEVTVAHEAIATGAADVVIKGAPIHQNAPGGHPSMIAASDDPEAMKIDGFLKIPDIPGASGTSEPRVETGDTESARGGAVASTGSIEEGVKGGTHHPQLAEAAGMPAHSESGDTYPTESLSLNYTELEGTRPPLQEASHVTQQPGSPDATLDGVSRQQVEEVSGDDPPGRAMAPGDAAPSADGLSNTVLVSESGPAGAAAESDYLQVELKDALISSFDSGSDDGPSTLVDLRSSGEPARGQSDTSYEVLSQRAESLPDAEELEEPEF